MTHPSDAPPEPGPDPLIGQTLCGKWTVERRIGHGGMATVYAARHRNGRRVALKVLRRNLMGNPRTVERFVREGYVANKLGHDGAVAILDDDVAADGSVFLVLEYLDGETLSDRCRRETDPVTLGEALRVTEGVLRILAAAHAAGIVHRDVKPGNVFLTRSGQVKLLDFGIARLDEPEAGSGGTGSGLVLGTPGFMSPEQARGRWAEVDGRTDVWGAGALLFFALTRRSVHEADTPNEVLIATATQPAPPLASFCAAPPTVCAVVDRALELHPGRRFSDAAAMADAIGDAIARVSADELANAPSPIDGSTEAGTLVESPAPAARTRDAHASRPALGRRSTWAAVGVAAGLAAAWVAATRSAAPVAPSAETGGARADETRHVSVAPIPEAAAAKPPSSEPAKSAPAVAATPAIVPERTRAPQHSRPPATPTPTISSRPSADLLDLRE